MPAHAKRGEFKSKKDALRCRTRRTTEECGGVAPWNRSELRGGGGSVTAGAVQDQVYASTHRVTQEVCWPTR